MRILLTVDVQRGKPAKDILVEVDPSATIGALCRALGIEDGLDIFVGTAQLDRTLTIAESPVVDGIALTSTPGRALLVNRYGSWPFTVQISSQGVLTERAMTPGEYSIGRLPENYIAVPDPAVSGRHASLYLSRERIHITDLGSTNGTIVEGTELTPSVQRVVQPGVPIELGDSIVTIQLRELIEIDLEPDGEGGLRFNRPPRLREPNDPLVVTFPDSINEREAGFDLLGSALPGATGLAYGSAIPLVGTGINVALQKRRQRAAKKELQLRQQEYEQQMAEIETTIDEEIARQRDVLLDRYPDPAALLRLVRLPSHRIWERRPTDDDDGEVRVGLGQRPASLIFESRGQQVSTTEQWIESAPITVDFDSTQVLGVAGSRTDVRSVARWLLGQLMFFRPPRDLLITILTDHQTEHEWAWFPLTPHSAIDRHHSSWLIGNNAITRQNRIDELVALIDERLAHVDRTRDIIFLPEIYVVLDGARDLRSNAGILKILREGPKVGIRIIALDEDPVRLPEECNGHLVLTGNGNAELKRDGMHSIAEIEFDAVDAAWTQSVAEELAPIRLFQSGEDEGIPRSLRFVEMLDLDVDNPQQLLQKWLSERRSTRAWVGQTATDPLILDLEKDGPHALVAGTTGAGKSEFLQTLVASLALVNTPVALNFVLVDYKGASAFAECELLPHTVGLVTNLDGHLTERALTSLEAELHRREVELRSMGAKDINDAWRHDPDRAAATGLARLVLVIDEFAELVQELPDFVSGLIRIARVGRSLGVHLVLATQRPAGVVTPEMRANTGLRVALRMEDKADSSEVIDTPDAAGISRLTPGRGFVRSGGSSLLQEFQTARVGGGRNLETIEIPPQALSVTWTELGNIPSFPKEEQGTHRETDLSAVCALISAAADLGRFPLPRRPWLEPLPELLALDDLTTSASRDTLNVRPTELLPATDVAVGLIDLPQKQSQEPFFYDLASAENWGIAGEARSGRTGVLLTIAVALMQRISQENLHVYGLDFGGGGLLGLTAFSHCGGVFRPSETERLERFVAKLGDEHRRRQNLLSSQGVSDITEYRRHVIGSQNLNYILVLIDRWELIFQEFPPESGSEIHATLSRLIREAATTGIRFILTGDRGILSDRISSHLNSRFALKLADLSDYRMLDLQPKNVPNLMSTGRAVRGGDGAEIQFASFKETQEELPRDALIRRADKLSVSRAQGQLRVDALPDRITVIAANDLQTSPSGHDSGLPFAVGGEEIAVIKINPENLRSGYLIAGPRRSGRTSAAIRFAAGALELGHRVVVLSGTSLPLFRDRFGEQITVLENHSLEGDFPTQLLDGESLCVLVVDGAEQYLRTTLDMSVLEIINRRERLRVVLTGTVEELSNDLRGCASTIKREQNGVILCPQSPIDGQLFSQRIERSLLGGPPGRGQHFCDGDSERIQILTD